jgi:hypothetical protein
MSDRTIRSSALIAGFLSLAALLGLLFSSRSRNPAPTPSAPPPLPRAAEQGLPIQEKRPPNVRVSVRHVLGNRPLGDVALHFEGDRLPDRAASGVTASDGTHVLTLPPGTYQVIAVWESRFRTEPREFSAAPGNVTEVDIVVATLPLVRISGRVIAEDQSGIANARVILTYDFDRKAPAEVDEGLDGEGSVAVTSGISGEYSIERLLYPWTYELHAAPKVLDSPRDVPQVFRVPGDQPVFALRVDLPVGSRTYTDLRGRILGPDGLPMRGLRVVARKLRFNARRENTGFSESVHLTDDDGFYRVRTAQDRVVLLTAHPSLGTKPLEVDAQVSAHARQEQRLQDLRLEHKPTPVEVKLVLEGSLEPLSARVLIHELEGGTSDVISFGNTSFAVRSDSAGLAGFRASPDSRYEFEIEGHALSRVEGAARSGRVKGLYSFPGNGGPLLLYVRSR